MRLYGQDIDESTTLLEAGLGWIVDWDKGDFVGQGGARGPARGGGWIGAWSASRCSTTASRARDTTSTRTESASAG